MVNGKNADVIILKSEYNPSLNPLSDFYAIHSENEKMLANNKKKNGVLILKIYEIQISFWHIIIDPQVFRRSREVSIRISLKCLLIKQS